MRVLFLLLLAMMLEPAAQAQTFIRDFTVVDRYVNGASPLTCSWECGLRVDRNTVGKSGGSFANTESPFMVWNRIGKDMKGREFSILSLTESWQDSGEAVPLYTKGVKRGAVGTWGATLEANDPEGKPGPLVGVEVDVFATGPATDHDGDHGANGGRLRIGVDVVGGDERFKETSVNSGAEGSLGLHIYSTSTTPWFRWITAARLTDYRRSGLHLHGNPTSSGWKPERAIRITGSHTVGLDFSGGDFQSVLRLKAGQAITFDDYDDWRIKREGDELVVQQNARQPDGTWKHVTVFAVTRQGEVKARKFTVLP